MLFTLYYFFSAHGITEFTRIAFFGRFRELVGETPARYLARWRMTLAARALAREDLSVAEVCERVGYTSVPSFTRAFRAQHGATPAAYRRARAQSGLVATQ